jgi:hypothetical protein
MATAQDPDWLKAHKEKKIGNPNWTPGMPSPNRAGRPKGIVDRRGRITQALLNNAEAVVRVLETAALGGDTTAMGIYLSKVVPPLKSIGERVFFSFDAKAPLASQVEAVLQAIANGEVPVDTGKQIVEAISALAGVRQVDELQARLEALEKRA